MIDSVIETIRASLPVRQASLSAETPLSKIVRDSIDTIELIAVLAHKYQIHIEPSDLEGIQTIGDIARYVELHAGEASDDDPLDSF